MVKADEKRQNPKQLRGVPAFSLARGGYFDRRSPSMGEGSIYNEMFASDESVVRDDYQPF